MKRIVRLPRVRGHQTLKGFIQLAALSAAVLFATVTQAEDLAEIYAKAQRNDPAIREAEANLLAEQQSRPQARAGLLPQISLDANYTDSVNDGTFNTQFGGNIVPIDQKSDTDTKRWSVSLTQALFNSDAWRTYKRSNLETAQAEADFQVAQQDLIVRVAEAYFNVLAAQDTLTSERARMEAIGRQLEQANRRFEVGLIAITDVKESQAAYDDAVALEIAARRSLATAKEAMREIIGEYPPDLAQPNDDFPLIPPEPQVEQDWVDVALQQNAALESSKINTDITRENIKISRAGHLPTLGLTAQVGNFNQEGTNTGSSGTSPIKNDQDQRQFGINFSLPIFSGGGTSAAVQESVYRHRASRENYEKVARSTEREARDAYLGVIAEIARVRALARSVESNQTALEATEAGYDVGTRTTVDVLDARDALSRAQTQYARSKYDYLINVLKLKQAAGTLNGADVADINNWLGETQAAAAAAN